MKKVLFALVMVLALAGCSFASHRVAMLDRLNITSEQFTELSGSVIQIFSKNLQKQTYMFYRSLNEMLLALNAGDVDEIALPEAVADYVMNSSPEYFINCVILHRRSPVMFVFGFKDDRKDIADSFNKALREMKHDGTLAVIQDRHINPAAGIADDMHIAAPTPSVFRKFKDAPTIRAAITGDLPPIDYIAADGKPEGFNVAILAEICARLGLNVELLSVDSGARAAALTSGRADVVFWFEYHQDKEIDVDIPEGVIVSEPYYTVNTYYHLAKKAQ